MATRTRSRLSVVFLFGDQMTKSNRIQFGIGRLMVVTTLVAFCMAISIRFDSPTVAQGIFAVYLMFVAGWVVVRGPSVFASLVEVNNKLRQIRGRRVELEQELHQRRRAHESKESPDGSNEQ